MNNCFKLIIAGSRNFDNYLKLCDYCDHYLMYKDDVEIVSGTANGADKLGEKYASERGYKIKRFPADWSLGKFAGYKRNESMAKYGDALVVFWDEKSKGTKHMIEIAKKYNLPTKIVLFQS